MSSTSLKDQLKRKHQSTANCTTTVFFIRLCDFAPIRNLCSFFIPCVIVCSLCVIHQDVGARLFFRLLYIYSLFTILSIFNFCCLYNDPRLLYVCVLFFCFTSLAPFDNDRIRVLIVLCRSPRDVYLDGISNSSPLWCGAPATSRVWCQIQLFRAPNLNFSSFFISECGLPHTIYILHHLQFLVFLRHIFSLLDEVFRVVLHHSCS